MCLRLAGVLLLLLLMSCCWAADDLLQPDSYNLNNNFKLTYDANSNQYYLNNDKDNFNLNLNDKTNTNANTNTNTNSNEYEFQRVSSQKSPSPSLDMYFPSKINWWSKSGKQYGNFNLMPIVPTPTTNVELANMEVAKMDAQTKKDEQNQLLDQFKELDKSKLQPQTSPFEQESYQDVDYQVDQPGFERKFQQQQRNAYENDNWNDKAPSSLDSQFKTGGTEQRIGVFDLGPMCPRGFERVGNVCRRKQYA